MILQSLITILFTQKQSCEEFKWFHPYQIKMKQESSYTLFLSPLSRRQECSTDSGAYPVSILYLIMNLIAMMKWREVRFHVK